MVRLSAIAVAAVLLAGTAFDASAQGWGGGWGPGGGWGYGWGRGYGWGGPGRCAYADNTAQCLRAADPERHAACWRQANDRGLRFEPRRRFMYRCMTQ